MGLMLKNFVFSRLKLRNSRIFLLIMINAILINNSAIFLKLLLQRINYQKVCRTRLQKVILLKKFLLLLIHKNNFSNQKSKNLIIHNYKLIELLRYQEGLINQQLKERNYKKIIIMMKYKLFSYQVFQGRNIR